MQQINDFLKQAGTYFLATNENGQPHVRPFGTINIYNDRMYILTGKSKSVSRQLHENPKLEICAMLGEQWLRAEATAVLDDDRQAKVSMLEAYPELKTVYSPDDMNTEVWYLRNVNAAVYTYGEPPVIIKF